MTGKRALAIFETGQEVEIYKMSPKKHLEIVLCENIANLKIVKEEPPRLVITLENKMRLEFVGTWGTNGQQCPKRPDA